MEDKLSFSRIKDVDREILSKLDDRNLLEACKINKYFWNQVCNEDFFRNRLLNNYSNIQKNKNLTWKEFYLRAIYYISKMKEDYGYVYNFGDYKKQYKILQNGENRNHVLIESSTSGELGLVIWSLQMGANIHVSNDYALRIASFGGFLEIVKYLIEKGGDIHALNDEALRIASFGGFLEIVKYLIERGADIHSKNDLALRWASPNGHLEVVKYLVEKGVDIHADNDEALRRAFGNEHLEVVKYLKSKK